MCGFTNRPSSATKLLRKEHLVYIPFLCINKKKAINQMLLFFRIKRAAGLELFTKFQNITLTIKTAKGENFSQDA